jgi:hypothetical protein
MRARQVIGFAIGSPALVAAMVLAIFAGAGLLVVAAGPIAPIATTRTSASAHLPPARALPSAAVAATARLAARDLEMLSSPRDPQAPAAVRALVTATTTGAPAQHEATQLIIGVRALWRDLARRAPDALVATIPIGYTVVTDRRGLVRMRLWSVVLAGNAALGITGAWATATVVMVQTRGAWRLAAMAPLAGGPVPQLRPPTAQANAAAAAEITGFTPLTP